MKYSSYFQQNKILLEGKLDKKILVLYIFSSKRFAEKDYII